MRSAAAARWRAAHAWSKSCEWQRRAGGGGGRLLCVGEPAASLRGLWCGSPRGTRARASRDRPGCVRALFVW